MKWICSLLCSMHLLFASDENLVLNNASLLSTRDLEIITSNPDISYVYMPEDLAESIKQIQSLYQEEDWDEPSKELYYYLSEGYKIVPHSVLENATKTSTVFLKRHPIRVKDLHWISETVLDNFYIDKSIKGQAHLPSVLLEKTAHHSSDTFELMPCFLSGPRGKRGQKGLNGRRGANGPPGSSSTFSGVVLDNAFTIEDATDQTKKLQFDVQGSPSTTTTIITNPTTNRSFITPDIDGTALVAQTGTDFVFIGGPTTSLFGSNSGIQYSSTFPSRAQIRLNQFGNNTGVPGVSTFKSRSTTIGGLAPVQPLDVIFRDTAVGVTGNLSIPLSGLISIVVAPNGVPAGQGWIATDYELQLVPLAGPANGRRQVFRVTSEGIFHIGEYANSMAGVAATAAGGSVTVPNTQITSTSRITLTIQDGGTVPTGFVYVSGRVVGTSFTIQSSTSDVGVQVYYQIWEPASTVP